MALTLSSLLAVWPDAAISRGAILSAIEDQRAQFPDSRLGVGGSWAGPKTLFEDRRMDPLRDWLLRTAPQPIHQLDGWGLVLEQGDSVAPHTHQQSHRGWLNTWAGVYYVSVPPDAAPLWVGHQRIDVHEGLAVWFPADTVHDIPPHQSSQPRISIAWSGA